MTFINFPTQSLDWWKFLLWAATRCSSLISLQFQFLAVVCYIAKLSDVCYFTNTVLIPIQGKASHLVWMASLHKHTCKLLQLYHELMWPNFNLLEKILKVPNLGYKFIYERLRSSTTECLSPSYHQLFILGAAYPSLKHPYSCWINLRVLSPWMKRTLYGPISTSEGQHIEA